MKLFETILLSIYLLFSSLSYADVDIIGFSNNSTDFPTFEPSNIPTILPTNSPTDYPTVLPSYFPTIEPSHNPSYYPTSEPSYVPSAEPTILPTNSPSYYPTDFPTSEPSFIPTAEPTTFPTIPPSYSPSYFPTIEPTEIPTFVPTLSPSSIPTSNPTAIPSTMPTSRPSSKPSSSPTNQPTGQPTSVPSNVPTSQPTSSPSNQPSSQPSSQPSTKPSSRPTNQPSSSPTAMPSNYPSSVPTSKPTTFPSSHPTSKPTNSGSVRLLSCNECQESYNNVCYLISKNILINCGLSEVCAYSGYNSIVVGPYSNVKTSKNCRLTFETIDNVLIRRNSTINAQSITFNTNGFISMNGTLTTFLQGPINGPGTSTLPTSGASYGGSGGKSSCANNTYFVSSSNQIGNISVIDDINLLSNNPTYGSGGGFPGSGLGGGRILLNASTYVFINGRLFANGGGAPKPDYGAGSGGSIVIIAYYLYLSNDSIVSVVGGSSISGGSGGGGRVAIYVNSPYAKNQSDIILHSRIDFEGGFSSNPCLSGSPGTFFISYQSKIGFIYFNNKHIETYSLSYLSNIPNITKEIVVDGYSNIISTSGIILPIIDKCVSNDYIKIKVICSLISIINSTLLLRSDSNLSTISTDDKLFVLNANKIIFISSNIYFNQSNSLINSNTLVSSIDTNIYFSDYLKIATMIGLFYGTTYQFPNNYLVVNSLDIYASINVTVSTTYVQNININSVDIMIIGNGIYVLSLTLEYSSCFISNSSQFTCVADVVSPLKYNNTVTLFAQNKLTILSSIYASNILICAVVLIVNNFVTLSTSGLGCAPNSGLGEGINGGGGGNGGTGGVSSFSNSLGGNAYSKSYLLTSGSGGSCEYNVSSSYGGGIIAIKSTGLFSMKGYLDSSGMNASNNCGGGAGGTIYIDSSSFNAYGNIVANGGDSFGNGGGGGGGFIYFGNILNGYSNFYLYGILTVYGGEVVNTYSLFDAYSSASTSGTSGIISYPSCYEGYGGSYGETNLDGDFCNKCPAGEYSTGGSQPCSLCTNAPTTAYYTESGSTSSNCDYKCLSGYVNTDCVTPFQNVIQTKLGGIYGFIGIILGGIFILVGPLIFFRLQRKYGWFESNKNRIKCDLLTIFCINLSNLFKLNTTYLNSKDELVIDINYKRSSLKLTESDLPHHAYRLNFVGSNHFLSSNGGSWRLSESRPVCLRSMLDRKEYFKFTIDINKLLEWNYFSFEVFSFYLFVLILPPLASSLLTSYRYRRAVLLIDYIYNYNYIFFKNEVQISNRNSIRLGISPDYTLAYIDFLYDEEKLSDSNKPISLIGQIKFPIIFKFAGLGSYFNPWYIDTNDIILQALSQTDIATSFIDEAWIAFVVELNAVLRTVYDDNPRIGIYRLLRFLQNKNIPIQLGGLVIELCLIENTTTLYDIDKIKRLNDIFLQSIDIDNQINIDNNRNSFDVPDEPIRPLYQQFLDFFTINKSRKQNKSNDFRDSYIDDDIYSMINKINESSSSVPNSPNSNTDNSKKDEIPVKNNNLTILSGLIDRIYSFINHYIDKSTAKKYNFNQSNHNFEGIYELLLSQNVSLGLKVSHPKVKENFYHLQDEDYLSDDDISTIKTNSSSSNTNSNSINNLTVNRDSLLDIINKNIIANTNIETTSLAVSPVARIYGRKANSMEKFYNITENIEKRLKNTNSDNIFKDIGLPNSKSNNNLVNKVSNIDSNDNVDIIQPSSPNREYKPTSNIHESTYIEFSLPSESRDSDIRLSTSNDISIGVSNNDLYVDSGEYNIKNRNNSSSQLSVDSDNNYGIKIKEESSKNNNKDNLRYNKSKLIKSSIINNVNIFDDMIINIRKTKHFIDIKNFTPSGYHMKALICSLYNNQIIKLRSSISNEDVKSIIESTNPLINRDTFIIPKSIITTDNSNNQSNQISTAFYLGYSLQNIYYYRLFNGFYGSLKSNLIFGSNVYPFGTRKVRIFLEFLIFSSSIIDFVFVATITTFMYCLGPDPTSCKSHYAIVLMYSLWPGSLILSPISGIVAIVLGPSSLLTRIYACWCRLSMISVLTILILYFHYSRSFVINYYVLYYVIGLVISRSVQVLTVDLYIAHLERARFTSGWDGLTTSLHMTKDNRIDMKY